MRGRTAAVIIGAMVFVILLVVLLASGMMLGPDMIGAGRMGWGGYGFNPVGWMIMLLFSIMIVGGIVWLAVWFFREATPVTTGPAAPSGSIEILKERYARGEITREQYEEMRRAIEGR
jgi:putative membrane protein